MASIVKSGYFNDPFDLKDATQLLIGGGAVAFAVYTSNTVIHAMWKSIVVLLGVTAFLIFVHYRRKHTAKHIIYALGFVTLLVVLIGLLLGKGADEMAIATVGGFIGGLGFDALLGKGDD